MWDGKSTIKKEILSLFQRRLSYLGTDEVFSIMEVVFDAVTLDLNETADRLQSTMKRSSLVGLEFDLAFILGIIWNTYVKELKLEEWEKLQLTRMDVTDLIVVIKVSK